jgi:hypothetical protein
MTVADAHVAAAFLCVLAGALILAAWCLLLFLPPGWLRRLVGRVSHLPGSRRPRASTEWRVVREAARGILRERLERELEAAYARHGRGWRCG